MNRIDRAPDLCSAAGRQALAARTHAAVFDFSFIQRLRIHGHGAASLLATAFAADVGAMAAGESREVVWRATRGGVRGLGWLARFGEGNFALQAFDADYGWFARAAPRFDAVVRDASGDRGVLLVLGPYAFGVLAAAGLEEGARLAQGKNAVFNWSGVTVTVGRWRSPAGFEIYCARDDSRIVMERLMAAGTLFDLASGGREALETLLLEAGVPVPGIDFRAARDDDAEAPPLASLMPAADGAKGTDLVLAGIECDSEMPVPFAPLLRDGAVVGRTLRSAYSPALRRAIALAQIPAAHAAPGTRLVARTVAESGVKDVAACAASLPFLA